MAEDVTLGEIVRNMARLEAEQRAQRADMVPAKLWAAEYRALLEQLTEHIRQADQVRVRLERDIADNRKAHERDMKSLRDEIKEDFDDLREEQSKRSEFTWSRVIGLVAAAAAVAGVIVAALAMSKGIH